MKMLFHANGCKFSFEFKFSWKMSEKKNVGALGSKAKRLFKMYAIIFKMHFKGREINISIVWQKLLVSVTVLYIGFERNRKTQECWVHHSVLREVLTNPLMT